MNYVECSKGSLTLTQMFKLSLFCIFILFAVLGCKEDDSFSFVEEGGSSPEGDGNDPDTNPEVGNSALTFAPTSYDFGPAAQSTESVNQLISVENNSTKEVFISDFEGLNTHFSILNSNCPTTPDALASGDDCQMTLQFEPQSAGSLSTTLLAKYGAKPGEDDLISIMGLSGTGVGALNFGGIDSIDQVLHNSVRINWTAEPTAVSFIIFRVQGGNLNYVDTLTNTGGTVNQYVAQSLTPNTSYTFRVKALDSLGNQDGNTTDRTVVTATNSAPTLAPIVPPIFYSGVTGANINARDSSTNSDLDNDGDAITYTCRYDNIINGSVGSGLGSCDALLNESGGSPSFTASTGVLSGWEPQHSDVGVAFEFEIEGSDPYGARSSVIFSGTIVAGSPASPTVTSVSPTGPANNNTPTLSGTSEADMDIEVFDNSSCSGSAIASGTADGSGDWSVVVTLSDDTTTTLYAAAVNSIGNSSDCSANFVSYIEDSTPPSVNIFSTTPSAFGDSTTPVVNGASLANIDIEIFSDSSCSTSLATGTTNGAGNFSIAVAVASESTTTFYAEATDTAGNVSDCSTTSATYTAFPIDPTNLEVWVDSSDATTLFQSQACSGAAADDVGEPVGCWRDKSGQGNHFLQSTAKPTLGTDGISFDGNDDVLSNSTWSLDASSVLTYFIAVKLQNQSSAGGSCCRPMLSWTTSSSGVYPWLGMTRSTYSPGNNLMFGFNGGPLAAQSITPGEFAIMSAEHDGANSLWNTFMNGGQNVFNQALPGSYGTTTLNIGGDSGNAARKYLGEILEVIMYNGTLSESRRENMEGYLACKWDIRHQLPLAHPFYNADGTSSVGCP